MGAIHPIFILFVQCQWTKHTPTAMKEVDPQWWPHCELPHIYIYMLLLLPPNKSSSLTASPLPILDEHLVHRPVLRPRFSVHPSVRPVVNCSTKD